MRNKDIFFLKKYLPDSLKKTIKQLFPKRNLSPTSCGLFMTDRCNFKCLGCRRSFIDIKHSKEMTLGTVKKLLSLYRSIRAFTIAGFGEPTLCEEFVDIVNFLKKERKKTHIITNGTNINRLLQLKYIPDRITISLYGYDANSYSLYTGVNAYNQIIENFLAIKESFDNVFLFYILNRENYRDLNKILSLCDKLQPVFLQLVNYLAYDITNKAETQKIISVKDKKIIEYIDELCKNRNYVKEKPVYIDFEHPKFNCSSYSSRINLDGDGNIGGCLRQIPPSLPFGNIFKEKNPFYSAEMKRLRQLQHTMEKTKIPPHKECNYCFGNWYPK
jgi:MoaA/NifB/PqqE/SkfB family radical SAM enzyme